MAAWLAAAALAGAARAAEDDPAARTAEDDPAARAIVERMNARDDGASLSRRIVMELVSSDGTTRSRTLRSFRRDLDGERRSVLFFEDPAAVKGTAFLSWDYADPARADDQWLYLPELRKTRRIALAERGRAFLGTDLSFEDMKKETKVEVVEYRWSRAGEEVVDGHACDVVEGRAADARTARETGYGRLRVRVDSALAVPRFIEYWTPDDRPLKAVRLLDYEAVDGVWFARRVEAEDLRTGHRTRLRFDAIDLATPVPDDLLTEAALRRGPP